MKEFSKFILNEELGFNLEVIRLSEFIFNKIIDSKPKPNRILLPDNKIGIKEVFIKYGKNQDNIEASIDVYKSNKKKIYITLVNITKDNIEHKLNHVLQLSKIGKEKFINKYSEYKSFLLTGNKFINNRVFNNFLSFKYFTLKTELDSYIYNIYYEVKQNIRKKEDLKNFNLYLNLSETYRMIKYYLYDYNVHDLKKIDPEVLILIFNVVEEKYKFIIKYNNRKDFITWIKSFFKKKSEFKIKNIDDYLHKMENIQIERQKYFSNKINKIYSKLNK